MNKPVLQLEHVQKSFSQGHETLSILEDSNLTLEPGEVVALVGPSGSGKSTLLQIAGLLDNVDSGNVFINGENCTRAGDAERTLMRRKHIGFIYQFHHLLPEFSACENIMIPQMIAGIAKKEARDRALELLATLGLKDRATHRPAELSGGEQQRVAIARAIVGSPSLLLADEPTGNLDPHTADQVFHMLLLLAKELGIATLIVTHNLDLARKTHRQVTLENKQLVGTDS